MVTVLFLLDFACYLGIVFLVWDLPLPAFLGVILLVLFDGAINRAQGQLE